MHPSKLTRGLSKFIEKFPKRIVFLFIVVTCVISLGIKKLSLTSSNRVFFNSSNSLLKEVTLLEQKYGEENTLFFCIVPKKGSIFTPHTFQVIQSLEDSLQKYDELIQLSSILSYKKFEMGFAGPNLSPLIPKQGDFHELKMSEISKTLMNDSLLLNQLLSPSGQATGIKASFQLKDETNINTFAKKMYKLANSIEESNPHVEIAVTGGIMIDAAFFSASLQDAKILIPCMYLLVFVTLWLISGSLFSVFSVLLVVLCSSSIAMGLGGWLKLVLSPPSSIAPIIILTVGVADSIHILVSFSHHRRQKFNTTLAISKALSKTFVPITLTSITSIIGFLSLNFSEVPPYRDMGNLVSVGIGAAYLFTILFLPALMKIFSDTLTTRHNTIHDIVGLKLGSFVVKHTRVLFFSMSLLSIATIFGIRSITFDDVFLNFFDKRYQFRSNTDMVIDNLTGLDYIECSFKPFKNSAITDSSYLAQVNAFTQWVNEQPEVIHAISISSILSKSYTDIYGHAKYTNQRPKQGMTKSIIKRYRKFQNTLNGPPRLISKDGKATRVLITLSRVSAEEIRFLENRIKAWIADSYHGKSHIASTSLLFAHLSVQNTKSMLRGVGLSLLLITVLIIVFSKSLRLGLLSIIPNIFPALMAFGIWGFLFSNAGLGFSIVSAMTLGIIVDDTIHFLFTIRQGITKGLSIKEAIIYGYRHVADAIVFTSIILIAGFSILVFSGFKPTVEMGILTALIILLALLTDLFLFPTLLIYFYRKKGDTSIPAATKNCE